MVVDKKKLGVFSFLLYNIYVGKKSKHKRYVAQLVERDSPKVEARGSNPLIPVIE